MSIVPLSTKLFAPHLRPGLVSRPRLIRRLNEGSARKLTLVSAPAGFGKTTLLSEWIVGHQLQDRTAWVSLDESDNDPARFWTYFFTALQTIHPKIDPGILDALKSSQSPPVEALLTGLINELAAAANSVILILDDLQWVSERPIHAGLNFLLDHMPAQMHLVLSSRADPPWSLALRRARGEINELRAADLRFTPHECASFLNQTMGLDLTAAQVAALETRTEGWITGLQMAALSMQGRDDIDAFIHSFGGEHRFILDYLVDEVLEHQSTGVQEFLLKTSILEQMNAALCAALMGHQLPGDDFSTPAADEIACQRLLETLDRSNLFVVRLDDERRWYRYHHLFTELLRGRLHLTQPGAAPILHQAASVWYGEHDLVDEAIHHALAGNNPTRAADLVERNGMQMIVDSRVSRLTRWLEALPDQCIPERPWLCVFFAWARYYIGPRAQVESYLQQAEQALALNPSSNPAHLAEAERKHIRGHIAALRAYLALQNQEFERIGIFTRQALDLLPEDDYARGTVAIALAETHRQDGDLVAMEAAYGSARLIAEKCENLPMAVSAIAYMAYQQAKQGYLHKAIETNREAIKLATYPDGHRLPAAGLAYVKMGDVLRELDELDSAHQALEEGIHLCRLWGHVDGLVNGYTYLARVRLAQGNLAGAKANLLEAEALTGKTAIDPWAICWLDDCRLRLWLVEGDLASAVQWTQISGLGIQDTLSYGRDLEHTNLARVLLAQGQAQPSGGFLDSALTLLDRILAASLAAGWSGRAIETLILQALAFQAGNQLKAALKSLSEAISMAEPRGYLRIFLDEGPPLEALLRILAQQGSPSKYTLMLQGAFEQRMVMPQPPVPGIENRAVLNETLTQREAQVLRLLVTDLSAPEIADRLGISVTTVRTHIQHLYDKLDIHSRDGVKIRAKDLL